VCCIFVCVFSRIKCGLIYISIAVWVWSEVLKRIFGYPYFCALIHVVEWTWMVCAGFLNQWLHSSSFDHLVLSAGLR